ncbi:hypothetical protein GCM10027273_03980 [Nocardioides pakistanensis]
MVLVGAFLPWLYTPLGTVTGLRGPGLWTMYAAFLGIAGAILRSPRLAGGHAAVMAAAAILLPLWQLGHLISKVGFGGWMPGAGLVMTLGAGVLAATAAVSLLRTRPAAQP